MTGETPGVHGSARAVSSQERQRVEPGPFPDGESVQEQAETVIAQFTATSRQLTMVFDPTLAATAARSVRECGTLASFIEALHQEEEAEGPVEPDSALADDGYDYTAPATAREAEAEMAAWRDLLHTSLPTSRTRFSLR